MENIEEKKFGRIAIISENNAETDFGKNYIIYYLFQKLIEMWQVDILLINPENKEISQNLKKCNIKIFNFSHYEFEESIRTSSIIINEGLIFNKEIKKATSLFYYIHNNPFYYDAFIFIGFDLSIISLLPLTKKRNCIIPLLFPRNLVNIENNQALRYALINCDYFFCHSKKEADIIRNIQPYAEIRNFPIMVDIDFMKEHLKECNEIKEGEEITLIIAEKYDATVALFASKMKNKFDNVFLLSKDEEKIQENDIKLITFNELIYNFRYLKDKIKMALLFMNRDFFPIIYNIAQCGIPIYLSPFYPWQELMDGDGLNLLSFDKEIDIEKSANSLNILPFGYYNYKLYTNYFVRFVNEWCIDNKIRWENLVKRG